MHAASLCVAVLLSAASLKTVLASDGNSGPAIPQAPGVLSVTLSPTTITGGSGGFSTGTVTLNGPAPAGGAVVTLASSNIELAATLPSITVPAGATSATFTVATNARYRAYSGLAFSATISATNLGSTRSATLNVTAQPRPPDFSSGSQAGANTQWDGLMCGGIAPIGGSQGILYNCSPAGGTGFGTCTFQEECSLGCRRVPPNGSTFNDFCASSGPSSVAISRNYIASGDRVPATIVAEAPAGQGQDQEQGVPGVIDANFNASHFPHEGGIGFPTGATSVNFDVATSYVPSIEFADVVGFWFNASIPPFLITNGRAGHAWLVMLPPDPPPAVAIPTLGDFKITGLNPVTGGKSSIGQIDLSGLSRVGGPTITLTSSHPAIVPSKSVVAPASQNLFGFQVFIETQPPAANTDVTITASDGRYSFSAILRVLTPPPPPVLSGVSVNPTSVVGGNAAIGTVTLSAAQSGTTVVGLSTPAPPSVATMPDSVTVPAGATSANFTINTSPVTSQFNMNIFANLAGSPGRQALLLITPGGPPPPTVSSLSFNPTTVVGGNPSTGTVTLSGAAPSGGASVVLSSSANAAVVDPSVIVPAGATSATFRVDTRSTITTTTTATISASLGGTTRSATLTVNPPPPPPPGVTLTSFSVSPASVTGGSPSTGTVGLSGAAPSGGVLVSLGSNQPNSASVPSSVTVAAGATSATFTVTTFDGSAATTVQLNAVLGDVILFTAITVNPSGSSPPPPPPPGATATLSVTATGRSGEQVLSSPAGINVTVGSTGSASFNVGTSITLSVSNERDAIWSGACSSGEDKTKTCTFALNGNAAVTAHVR